MNWIALILTCIGIVLNAKKKSICWSVNLVANVIWIVHFIGQREYAGVVVNVLMIFLNFYGWLQWTNPKNTGSSDSPTI